MTSKRRPPLPTGPPPPPPLTGQQAATAAHLMATAARLCSTFRGDTFTAHNGRHPSRPEVVRITIDIGPAPPPDIASPPQPDIAGPPPAATEDGELFFLLTTNPSTGAEELRPVQPHRITLGPAPPADIAGPPPADTET